MRYYYVSHMSIYMNTISRISIPQRVYRSLANYFMPLLYHYITECRTQHVTLLVLQLKYLLHDMDYKNSNDTKLTSNWDKPVCRTMTKC